MREATVSCNAFDGSSYPNTPWSTTLCSSFRMGCGAWKSISATHMGSVSLGYHVHLLRVFGLRRFGVWSKLYAIMFLVSYLISSYFLYATIIPSRAGMRETIQSRSDVTSRVKRRMASVVF